ncbi:glycosyltransferase family 39 protein [Actinomadura macra]|uniref:glycosyltransferase family 39 protein n=1 Tax=Actinomadura macra TaxID=46164 RepID=UPI000A4E6BC6|nr:glycosyltransferase family 39 protein [Actinomadura macra]
MAGDSPHGTMLDEGAPEEAALDEAGSGDTPGGTMTITDSATEVETVSGSGQAAGGGTATDSGESPAPDEPSPSGDEGRQGRAAELWAMVRRHPAFTVIIATAALLRLIAMIGYQPAMFFNDSFDYLHVAMEPFPHPLRPDGYSFLLLALKPFHSFALVVLVQHLMGLAMGVMIYALLRRRFGLPGWGATIAAAPVLLDGYQIQLEELVLSDTMFTFLVMCAVTLLLWRDRPTWKVAASVGLIVGVAWLTRSVGMPVLLGVLAFMLIRRSGWRLMAVTLVACMLPVLAYMGWYKADSGKFAITESNGIFLYARVYKFADCHKMHDLPVSEYALCTEPANRLPNSQDGIWNARSPLNRYTGKRFSPENNALGNDFAKRAIVAQPVDYLRVVAHDFFKVFRWERTVFPDEATYRQYEFRKTGTPLPDWHMDADSTASGEAHAYEDGNARTQVVEPFAGVIRGYQDYFYLRGTMLGGILLIGLAGMVPLWRRFGGAALLPWTLATGLLLAPAATAEFDYRYVLPAVPLAALAAGMAFTPEARGRFAALPRRVRRLTTRTPSGATGATDLGRTSPGT